MSFAESRNIELLRMAKVLCAVSPGKFAPN
jgi:hypothetical protein